MPEQLIVGLDQARAMMRRKRWLEAREILEPLDRRYPDRPEVLAELVNVYLELEDMSHHQWACERILKHTLPDPDLMLALAGSYLLNFRPALSLLTFRSFLKQWPDHEEAAKVRQEITSLGAKMDDLLAELGEAGEEGLEIAAMHEQVQSLLEQGKYSQGRKVAEKLLSRRPNFVPVLNNLSQMYFIEGSEEQAINTAQRVLDLDPENFHALSNLTRYLYLSGRTDEAARRAAQLKALKSNAEDAWIKKAEALSYMGDDQGVLEVFKEAAQTGAMEDPLLHHLAAVAAMRLGREDEARAHWRRALKLAPGFELAKENMEDLRQRAGQRHAPWAFMINNWVQQKTIEDLFKVVESASRRKDEKVMKRAVQRYLNQHPEVVRLIPILLNRGDPQGREFAMRTALMSETPEMLAALRDFALGQCGPDEMRFEAANAASAAGLMPAGTVRLWMQGEWRDLLLFGFELHDDPIYRHRPNVAQLLADGTRALHDGKVEQAERLLKQALEIEPDSPDILNNLAIAYEMQGRSAEALSLEREIHQRHPDYLFARVGLARKSIADGRLDEAEALLKPLLSRRRLHFSELAALCHAQIELFVAQNNTDAARSWLEMWAGADPDHPGIAHWRAILGKNLKEKLSGWRSLLSARAGAGKSTGR